MSRMFGDVYPDVPVPKSVWRWIDSAQHRLARAGAVGALSVVDLLICDTAAARGLVVLHDDADYELAERTFPTSECGGSSAPTTSGFLWRRQDKETRMADVPLDTRERLEMCDPLDEPGSSHAARGPSPVRR